MTLSIRLRPTRPLSFAKPLGDAALMEFRRMRADSQVLAARTTDFANTE